jgi:basic membrane lipoprotein Med (substrate-binding protein (PBP1-ABC) superfamily)
MMSEFKIPKFLSKEFNKASHTVKAELTADYKAWYDKEMTAMWIRGFNTRIEDLIKEEESLTPTTSFEFQHQVISNRAERLVLRSLIKEMNYKV